MYWISEEVISCNKYLSALLFRQFDTFTSNTIYCHFFTKVCTCGIKASGQWLISDRSVVPKKVYILLQKRMFIIYVTPVAFHIFVVIIKRLKKKRQTSNQQNLDNQQKRCVVEIANDTSEKHILFFCSSFYGNFSLYLRFVLWNHRRPHQNYPSVWKYDMVI